MVADSKKTLSNLTAPGATGIHWFKDDETAEITTADKKLMTQIRKLSKACDEVVIDQEPSADNGGFMLALIPVECIKLGVKRKLEMTEEQKAKRREVFITNVLK